MRFDDEPRERPVGEGRRLGKKCGAEPEGWNPNALPPRLLVAAHREEVRRRQKECGCGDIGRRQRRVGQEVRLASQEGDAQTTAPGPGKMPPDDAREEEQLPPKDETGGPGPKK